ncbi:Uncharacterized protein LSUB1_G000205 [Lachnellula subtilissima]|uniref:DUF1479 domain protein n=1 Tax=Lachnellula subtilissima TaxID=602034 RepID=A0A8H8S3S5_9HELO|nr:Uncharacterized protein LSUB1_G000205 [Lachnellula subtilissima]
MGKYFGALSPRSFSSPSNLGEGLDETKVYKNASILFSPFDFSLLTTLPLQFSIKAAVMLSILRAGGAQRGLNPLKFSRTITTATQTQTQTSTSRGRGPRKEGDISSVFASLSGTEATPLPARFASIKQSLLLPHAPAIVASWSRLLSSLRSEISEIATAGSDIIPSIDFEEIHNHSRVQPFANSLRKRGAAIIRGVVPEEQALGWKSEIRDYLIANPQTKAFPKDNPAVFELYWSPGQIKARANANVIETQRFLMSFWHSSDPNAAVWTDKPVSYADRLRIRKPGDAGFALGAHVDGGSVERWEADGYGKGHVYDKVFEGRWEEFDPWESSGRLQAESDLYNGAGACSMFRMFQGWLSMSDTRPGEGTLLGGEWILDEKNWELDIEQSSVLQGASLGCTLELNDALHPHLELSKSMIHVPEVRPGDYVAWHCDSLHAVDKIHAGKGDSSVLYIPACPLTKTNAEYLVRQREAFLDGTPGPDFPGGIGESEHAGRMTKKDVEIAGGKQALIAMGLGPWETGSKKGRGADENGNIYVI